MKSNRISFLLISFMALSVFVPACWSQATGDGEKLVDKHACKNCHLIKGSGGSVGPPLDGIGEHRDENYIVYKLTVKSIARRKKLFPIPYELMSHVHVSKGDAIALAHYLRSLPAREYKVAGHGDALIEEVPLGFAFKPDERSQSSDRGMELFKGKGCFACHSVGGNGGAKGPNLDGIGARRSRKFITDRVRRGAVLLPQPSQKSGQTSMPALKLSEIEIKNITDWLMTLPSKEKKPAL